MNKRPGVKETWIAVHRAALSGLLDRFGQIGPELRVVVRAQLFALDLPARQALDGNALGGGDRAMPLGISCDPVRDVDGADPENPGERRLTSYELCGALDSLGGFISHCLPSIGSRYLDYKPLPYRSSEDES